MTSGSISFNSLVGIGSNIHVVDFDDLTSLDNSSSHKAVNELNFSSGTLQCTVCALFSLILSILQVKNVHKVINAVLFGNIRSFSSS